MVTNDSTFMHERKLEERKGNRDRMVRESNTEASQVLGLTAGNKGGGIFNGQCPKR